MSVLNQSGEEQVECPLCMEPLEVDDLNFFPCTCGYQICRFCWHRIRTDENGLCPACRKAYSENPADFTPLSKEQVAQLKAEKRQRDQLRKAKLSESRKHLASVRVVQRNLVFVVGLPMRLADPEILKKHEYFGKFGKIHKVVINQSTSYAGTQGPSASAYVTYLKSDDALRAIQSVNNTTLDGKTIKTSLGTTKYCSHFMKNQTCPKPDCMYLHDFGDQEASFTKEQMHAGKHQEYEKKLHESLLAKQAAQQAQAVAAAAAAATNTTQQGHTNNHSLSPLSDVATSTSSTSSSSSSRSSKASKEVSPIVSTPVSNSSVVVPVSTNKEVKDGNNWPQLDKDALKGENNRKHGEKSRKNKKQSIAEANNRNKSKSDDSKDKESREEKEKIAEKELKRPAIVNTSENMLLQEITQNHILQNNNNTDKIEELSESITSSEEHSKLSSIVDDSSSFFTLNSYSCAKIPIVEDDPNNRALNSQEQPLLDMSDGDAWDFNFGYTNHSNHLEELAKQRGNTNISKDPLDSFANGLGLDTFTKLDGFMDAPYVGPPSQTNTESLLETLAKNSVNYQNMQQQPLRGGFPLNGHKDLLGLIEQQQQHVQQQANGFPKIMDMYRNMCGPQHPPQMNGLHMQSNGFHNNFPQQPQQQQHYINMNNLNLVDKHNALLQQRQLEENFLNLSLGKQMPHQQQPQRHPLGYMNGHYDSNMHNGLFPLGGGTFGMGNNSAANNSTNQTGQKQSRHVVDEKDLDYRFQEAQKALEALVESDSHVHNSDRNSLVAKQQNGLVHSQSGNHLPPPPPGFVQPSTHMNSFGSKILPFLNMNSQQQQQQITSSQNNWPSSFSQMQQQQQQQQQQQPPNQHKGMGGVCNDWKVLDPAILSSRRHIPSMGTLIDQYNPQQAPPQAQQHQSQQQQRSFDMYVPFSNYSGPLQPSFNNSYGNHHVGQSNLNWLAGGELNAPISTPPGFRTAGQATKQQEC